MVVETPRLRTRAASRALSPASTSSTARTLRSLEYPFAIDCPRSCCRRREPNLICESEGIPCDRSDSHQTETALVHLARAQIGDGRRVVAELGQDLLVVLAEPRRRPIDRRRRARECHGLVHHRRLG